MAPAWFMIASPNTMNTPSSASNRNGVGSGAGASALEDASRGVPSLAPAEPEGLPAVSFEALPKTA